MIKKTKIRNEVLARILLAKKIYNDAELACSNLIDQTVFTKGIFLLHDAAEIALAAVANHLNAEFKDRNYLLSYYKLIKDQAPRKGNVPLRREMERLNTIRNTAKHEGILPDTKSNAYLASAVYSLFEKICKKYLDLEFSSISLKSLIRDERIREYINKAEKNIDIGKIKEAFVSLAYAMFYICESLTIPLLYPPLSEDVKGEAQYYIPPMDKTAHMVNLIGHGVDLFQYDQFKTFVPKIGRYKKSGKTFHQWDKYFGHPANWTKEKAEFCLHFCIETALKFQKEPYEKLKPIFYFNVYVDVIKAKTKETAFWDNSIHSEFSSPMQKRKKVLSLKRGQSIEGYVIPQEFIRDEWYVASRNIPPKLGNVNGSGYVLKKDVIVTQRKITT